MNYWPISVIAQSPLAQHPGFVWELSQMYKRSHLSEAAFYACGEVARRTAPRLMPNLVILESVGTPARQVFIAMPELEEWSSLERGAVTETNGMLSVFIDALH